ncbi:MAG: NAD-dependent epimerase/dehydratase [Acidobacteria bacterium]|nr:NAD-dependent epimerase/dehydratase [Acidobacteriota bacterium]
MVAIFLDRLLAARECLINGDGLQTRDYTFVADVVAANLAALGRPGFHVYNVGTGIETDVVRLYRQIADALGIERPAVHGPAKGGEQRRSVIAAGRLEHELGVRVATPLADGIAATAAWFAARAGR